MKQTWALFTVLALTALFGLPRVGAANLSILFCSPSGATYGWLDLTYLEELNNKGFAVDYTEKLADVTPERVRKYNVLMVFDTPKSAEFAEVVKNFAASGGGVLSMIPEYNIEKQHATDLLKAFGARVPVERIIEDDKAKIATFDHMPYPAAFTDQIAPSPVSAGVRGIWYPYSNAYNAQHTCPIIVDSNWQVVVTASPTAHTLPVDMTKSAFGPLQDAFARPEGVKTPPLFAVRSYGKGRVALISQWQQYSVGQGTKWLYDRQILRRGCKDKPSDFGCLLENTYRWLAEPSQKAGVSGGFVTNPEKLIPPNRREEVKRHYVERVWKDEQQIRDWRRPSKDMQLFRGIIGVKSSYSSGKGTVADYAAAAQQAGLDFIVFMEDFQLMTPQKLESMKKECEQLSSDKVKLFAGYSIDNNIGNHLFTFGPEVPWAPDRCLTGPNNTLLNQQYQDKDGKFLNQQGPVLDWFLMATHVEHAQVGFYRFLDDPRSMRIPDLRTYGMAAVRYYEHGKLMEDVTDQFFTTAQGTLPPAAVSVNLVTSPEELGREAASGNALVYAQSRTLQNIFKDALRWTHQYDGVNVFASDGPQILAWPDCHRVGALGSEEFVTGNIFMPSLVWVTAAKGLKEVFIFNGRNIYRRFKFNGEKEWDETLYLEAAVQKNLVLVVEDTAGGKAVSFARRCWKDGAREVVFCSDHVNDCKSYGMLLGRGPTAVPMTRPPELPTDIAGYTWDGGPAGVLPMAIFQGTPPVLYAEEGTESGDRFTNIPLLEFTDEGAAAVASERKEVIADEVPSGSVMNPWHGYGPKEPSKLMDHTLRFREWLPPTVGVPESGWAGPGVREGSNACLYLAEITFKQDMKLKNILLARNWHQPQASPAKMVLGDATGVKAEKDYTQMPAENIALQPGDWFGLYSPSLSNTQIFVNRGAPVVLHAGGGPSLVISAPVQGKAVKVGDKLSYEIASITYPVDVEVKDASGLAGTMDYLRSPEGMHLIRGKRIPSEGLVEVEPQDFVVEVSVPRPKRVKKFTLPLLIRNLNPRWSAGLFQRKGYVKGEYGTGEDRYRPIGIDLSGNAYVPLYVSWADLTSVAAGHPVVSGPEGKDLFIQVTHVNRDPHLWHVSVNNPTDKPITATLKKMMDLPGFDFQEQKVTISAGGYVVVHQPFKSPNPAQ